MNDRPKPSQKKQVKPKQQAPKAAKKAVKKKTVAAEGAEIVRREDASPPAPPSAPIKAASRHVAEAADAVRRAQAARSAPAKPSVRPPVALRSVTPARPQAVKPAPSPAAKAEPPRITPKPAPSPVAKAEPPRISPKPAPSPAVTKAEPPRVASKPKARPVHTAPSAAPAARPQAAAPAEKPKPAQAATAAMAATPMAAFATKPAGPSLRADGPFAGAAETHQQSFRAAVRGSAAVNQKLMDIARANLASGFDLAKSLASARTPLEAAQLQFAFFSERMRALASQAEELRALSAACLTEASEPFRHLGRKFDRKS